MTTGTRKSGARRRAGWGVFVVTALVALHHGGLRAGGDAEAVRYWNEIADTTSVFAGAPPFRIRVTAMTQVAVHDALNAIWPRYRSYADVPRAAKGASSDAAVAAAAVRVLSQTVPSQAAALGALYDAWIAGLPACHPRHPACVEDGIDVGLAAADAMLALRAGDGSATPHLPYTLPAAPGVYQPTPPGFVAPQFAGWAHLTPFVLRSGDQFRADPSPVFDLLGEVYTRDFLEVKRVGSTTSETDGHRTADQSAIARFWPGGGANFNAVTRAVVADRGLDAWELARLLALVNLALNDSAIATFDTKYTYNFWRPATAIRAAETDGNPLTDADPAWLSYQATPPYPDYTCGLTTNTGAAIEVIRLYFRTNAIGYTLTAAGMTRSFVTLSQAEAEAVDARVFGGMHFRTGCVQGIRMGRQVGRFVVRHALAPVR